MATTGRAARLTDVARAAGVGISITSRVLNGEPTVSIRPQTRERILTAARELDYHPNAFARGLKLRRTMTLGIVLNLTYYHELADVVVAVERAAAAAGYVVLIADTADFIERGDAYRRLLREHRVDGLLIASVLVSDAFAGELKDEGVPLVVLNRRIPGRGLSASVDDARGVALAVEHLAELGHERIGYVAGPTDTEPVRRRLAGFRAGMSACGLSLAAEHVRRSPVDDQGVCDVTTELLATNPRPTAMIVWSPTAAVPALAAARRLGLRLPDDLSLMSYNDSPIAGFLDPPLTTVRMPLAEMAHRGVECLLRQIGGKPTRSVVVRTPPALVVRGSTGPAT